MNIQIFGTKKSFDTKKAQRFFKERRIKVQFIDLKEKEMSKGELTSVMQAVGGIDKLLNPKAKDDARERREDDSVVRAICQMRPIWRIELVNVDTSSPPHTKQILNCHEWHSETDLRREVSNIMVMSNREMACRKTARRHNSAAF